MALPPIVPLARIIPQARPTAEPRPVTPITPSTTPPPSGILTDEEAALRRREFDQLSIDLRLHRSGEKVMEPLTYKRTLTRALDIITSLNETSASTGKSNKKKIGQAAKAPASFADL